MNNQEGIAWAAGLFEGEGCITVRDNGVFLQLGSTDKDVVDRFHRIVGVGAVCMQKRPTAKKTEMHIWYLGKRTEVRDLLGELMPWFGVRRLEKAEEAMARLETFYRRCGRDGCEVTFLAGRHDRVYCSASCSEKVHRDRVRDAWRVKNWAPV